MSSLWRPVQMRAVTAERREIEVVAVPYGQPAQIGRDVTEEFAPGAFRRSLAFRGDRIKLTIGHGVDGRPVGRAVHWDDTDQALIGVFKISRTRDGDEALEMAADGVLDASIEFIPVKDRWSDDGRHVVRVEAQLHRLALVPEPAYDGARVLAVREPSRLAEALALLDRIRQGP